jgi:endo-1,4-beta-xylanase
MQYKRYRDLFQIFLRHADTIDRVTVWGITDNISSGNNFPVPGRTDYPLLFDRNYKAKPIVNEIIKLANILKQQ